MHGRAVREVMTSQVVTVHQDASFKAVVRALEERHVDAAPVVDDDGRLVGIVSESDLTCHEGSPPRLVDWFTKSGRQQTRKSHGHRARDLMSTPVQTIAPDATVGAALREMTRHHVGRLVVTDDDGIAGILTRSDLLRVFLRADEEIHADVLAAVNRAVGDCPSRLSVQVDEGIVSLKGWVQRTSAAWAASAAARSVPGVVEIIDDLESEIDDTEVHEMSVRGPFL